MPEWRQVKARTNCAGFHVPVTSVQSRDYLPTGADFADWDGPGHVKLRKSVWGAFDQQFDPQSAQFLARQFDPWFDRL